MHTTNNQDKENTLNLLIKLKQNTLTKIKPFITASQHETSNLRESLTIDTSTEAAKNGVANDDDN